MTLRPTVLVRRPAVSSSLRVVNRRPAYNSCMITNKKLRQMYDDFNARYFLSRLPQDMVLRFVRQRDAGRCVVWLNCPWPWRITLRPELRHWPNVCALTLLHEMAHAHCQFKGLSSEHFDHGPTFVREKARLLRAGAFTPYL